MKANECYDNHIIQLSKDYPDILRPSNIWMVGITQDSTTGDYYLCKTSRGYCRTTDNKYLDLFLMESQNNRNKGNDSYVQWIDFSQVTNMQEMPSPQHGCTHLTNLRHWSNSNMSRIVILKKIVDGQNAQSYDFYQVIISYCY